MPSKRSWLPRAGNDKIDRRWRRAGGTVAEGCAHRPVGREEDDPFAWLGDSHGSGGKSPFNPPPDGGPYPLKEIKDHASGAVFRKRSIADITSSMKSFGDGSRGIVVGDRGSGERGRAFNVVNQKGIILFLDGQSKGEAGLDDDCVDFFVIYTQKGKWVVLTLEEAR